MTRRALSPHAQSRAHALRPTLGWVVAWVVVGVVAPTCHANPDAKRLYDDLLSSYNRLIRPVQNNTDTITVWMRLRLSQLIDLVSARRLRGRRSRATRPPFSALSPRADTSARPKRPSIAPSSSSSPGKCCCPRRRPRHELCCNGHPRLAPGTAAGRGLLWDEAALVDAGKGRLGGRSSLKPQKWTSISRRLC